MLFSQKRRMPAKNDGNSMHGGLIVICGMNGILLWLLTFLPFKIVSVKFTKIIPIFKFRQKPSGINIHIAIVCKLLYFDSFKLWRNMYIIITYYVWLPTILHLTIYKFIYVLPSIFNFIHCKCWTTLAIKVIFFWIDAWNNIIYIMFFGWITITYEEDCSQKRIWDFGSISSKLNCFISNLWLVITEHKLEGIQANRNKIEYFVYLWPTQTINSKQWLEKPIFRFGFNFDFEDFNVEVF